MRSWRRLPPRPQDVGRASDPRFSFANERTFLAWNRTALALIGGGLAADQLLDTGPAGGGHVLGVSLMLLGGLLVVGAYLRWHTAEIAMRLRLPLRHSRAVPALFGAGVTAFALFSLVLVVLGALQ